jgi:hypothetical protein
LPDGVLEQSVGGPGVLGVAHPSDGAGDGKVGVQEGGGIEVAEVSPCYPHRQAVVRQPVVGPWSVVLGQNRLPLSGSFLTGHCLGNPGVVDVLPVLGGEFHRPEG